MMLPVNRGCATKLYLYSHNSAILNINGISVSLEAQSVASVSLPPGTATINIASNRVIMLWVVSEAGGSILPLIAPEKPIEIKTPEGIENGFLGNFNRQKERS